MPIFMVLASSAEEIAHTSTVPASSLPLYIVCTKLMSATLIKEIKSIYGQLIRQSAWGLLSVSTIETCAMSSVDTRGDTGIM